MMLYICPCGNVFGYNSGRYGCDCGEVAVLHESCLHCGSFLKSDGDDGKPYCLNGCVVVEKLNQTPNK